MQSKSTMFAPRRWLRAWFRDFKTDLADTLDSRVVQVIIGFVLFLVFVAVFVTIIAAPGRPAPPRTAASYKANAISLCRDQMRLQLRSPSEATFPATSTARTLISGNGITIRDSVDAPNAFGTPVRTDFGCVVELSSDFSTSTITDFDTYPR